MLFAGSQEQQFREYITGLSIKESHILQAAGNLKDKFMKIQLEDKWMMVLQSLVGALNTSTKHSSATATATCHINSSAKKGIFYKIISTRSASSQQACKKTLVR